VGDFANVDPIDNYSNYDRKNSAGLLKFQEKAKTTVIISGKVNPPFVSFVIPLLS
jgi:hypothetical protein